jgi:hypothetical protein
MSYLEMRHNAMVLRDIGGYDLDRGEMNPAIFEEFLGEVVDSDVIPAIWEPFAGHTGNSRSQDFAQEAEVMLISYDLEPSDTRVVRADSTKCGPRESLGGVLFHPPYFGSAPLSGDEADLSVIESMDDYVISLQKTVDFVKVLLVKEGLVCAVGRDYRHGGERVSLASVYLEMFGAAGMSLLRVWLSEPDVILVFRK